MVEVILEIIFEAIVYFFVEILFKTILIGAFRGVKLIGLVVMKAIMLSRKPIGELEEKHKDSSKPYFLGFAVTFGIIYLIVG